jgi:hypothetical protein
MFDMPNHTTHYNLIKPLQEDFYNVEDFNKNADAIDEALHSGAFGLAGKMPADATPPLRNAVTGDSSEAGLWYRVASISVPAVNQNATISMHVAQIGTESPHHPNGVLRLDLRTGTPNEGCINWEYVNLLAPENFVLAYNNTLPAVAELWVRVTEQNRHYRFDVIAEGNRDGNTAPIWTLHNRANPVTQITPGLIQKVSARPAEPVVTGTYTGNGESNRVFDLGFRPKGVMVVRTSMGSEGFSAFAVQGSSADGTNLVIVNTGFMTVGSINFNGSGSRRNYVAFR